jgi:hypothetical protein
MAQIEDGMITSSDSETDERRVFPPDASDVLAAARFLEMMNNVPIEHDVLTDYVRAAGAIFRVWVKTLDLDDGED